MPEYAAEKAGAGTAFGKSGKNTAIFSKKNFKYDGPQLEMNQDSYKEFKIWDKELNRVYKLL